jgi:hypothetical protein
VHLWRRVPLRAFDAVSSSGELQLVHERRTREDGEDDCNAERADDRQAISSSHEENEERRRDNSSSVISGQ